MVMKWSMIRVGAMKRRGKGAATSNRVPQIGVIFATLLLCLSQPSLLLAQRGQCARKGGGTGDAQPGLRPVKQFIQTTFVHRDMDDVDREYGQFVELKLAELRPRLATTALVTVDNENIDCGRGEAHLAYRCREYPMDAPFHYMVVEDSRTGAAVYSLPRERNWAGEGGRAETLGRLEMALLDALSRHSAHPLMGFASDPASARPGFVREIGTAELERQIRQNHEKLMASQSTAADPSATTILTRSPLELGLLNGRLLANRRVDFALDGVGLVQFQGPELAEMVESPEIDALFVLFWDESSSLSRHIFHLWARTAQRWRGEEEEEKKRKGKNEVETEEEEKKTRKEAEEKKMDEKGRNKEEEKKAEEEEERKEVEEKKMDEKGRNKEEEKKKWTEEKETEGQEEGKGRRQIVFGAVECRQEVELCRAFGIFHHQGHLHQLMAFRDGHRLGQQLAIGPEEFFLEWIRLLLSGPLLQLKTKLEVANARERGILPGFAGQRPALTLGQFRDEQQEEFRRFRRAAALLAGRYHFAYWLAPDRDEARLSTFTRQIGPDGEGATMKEAPYRGTFDTRSLLHHITHASMPDILDIGHGFTTDLALRPQPTLLLLHNSAQSGNGAVRGHFATKIGAQLRTKGGGVPVGMLELDLANSLHLDGFIEAMGMKGDADNWPALCAINLRDIRCSLPILSAEKLGQLDNAIGQFVNDAKRRRKNAVAVEEKEEEDGREEGEADWTVHFPHHVPTHDISPLVQLQLEQIHAIFGRQQIHVDPEEPLAEMASESGANNHPHDFASMDSPAISGCPMMAHLNNLRDEL